MVTVFQTRSRHQFEVNIKRFSRLIFSKAECRLGCFKHMAEPYEITIVQREPAQPQ
jgi:hypothetical protein